MDDLLTILLVVGLLTIVTVGIFALVSMRVSNVTVESGRWVVCSESVSLPGTNGTFEVKGVRISIEAITAVDKFYNPRGDWGVIGVEFSVENKGSQTVVLPLKDAYFIDSHGRKVSVEMKTAGKYIDVPHEVDVPANSKFEISLVAKNSLRDVVIDKTPVHLVTLLAKEGQTAYFVLPMILNGREKLYKFRIKFISR